MEMLLFQCPWPLNANTVEEVKIKDDLNSSSASSKTSGKKRKKEKCKAVEGDSSSTLLGDSLSENLDKLDSILDSPDKCKSPNSKKLKLANGDAQKENSSVIVPDEKCSSSSEGRTLGKTKRLGSKEKDIINYLNVNFNNSPNPTNNEDADVPAKEQRVEDANRKEGGKDEDKADADKDSLFFKAIPVAVRQPIKLPKHASNILSSRHVTSEAADGGERSKLEDEDDLEDSDLECSLMSDPDNR